MLKPGDAFRPSFGDPVETKDAMLVNRNADNLSVVEVDARDNQGKCLNRL
jgi:hypothetical protein